jgi:hypothetical protein
MVAHNTCLRLQALAIVDTLSAGIVSNLANSRGLGKIQRYLLVILYYDL